MTYSVYQHWDPLKVMAVGVSYPPELYDYIKNERVRKVFYQIAEETEEDYQKLINLLHRFGVQTVRPDIECATAIAKNQAKNNRIINRPYWMQPRDYSIMLGETFYCSVDDYANKPILSLIEQQGNKVISSIKLDAAMTSHIGKDLRLFNNVKLNAAMTSRIGKDLIIGTHDPSEIIHESLKDLQKNMQNKLPDYRVTMIDTQGHTDGCFCPVVPGLILSVMGQDTYEETFPGWEVVYLQGESWGKMHKWQKLKLANKGKWWMPGEELNDDFTQYVEQWMNHWVGYVEESVFDVNMIVVDKQNVIVNGYNQKVFDALSKRGITPHICNFRHRYFWDGGLHCITSDLHREGVMEDYFPERNQ
jgi:N-dimethylarginine dimethylaminohydrolase